MLLFVTSLTKKKRIQCCSCCGISVAEIVCLTLQDCFVPPSCCCFIFIPLAPLLCLADGSPNMPKPRPRSHKAEGAWKYRQVFVPASPSAAPQGALRQTRKQRCWLKAVSSGLGCRRAKQGGRGAKIGYQCVHFYNGTPNNRGLQKKTKAFR